MDPATDLEWLCDWFISHCDGDWEHEFGITIGTLDNPGWSFRVDLTGTGLSARSFVPREVEEEDGGWLRLWKDDTNVFHAAGSPTMLAAMIKAFREWASGS